MKPKRKKRAVKKKPSRFIVFLKYLAIVSSVLVVLYFMFVNRHEIKDQIIEKTTLVKEKIMPSKNKPQLGYKKEDRKRLEMLIHEGAKVD